MRRIRWRRVGMRAGVVALSLIAVIWFASGWWYAGLATDPASDHLYRLGVENGSIFALSFDMRAVDRNYSGVPPAKVGRVAHPGWRWRFTVEDFGPTDLLVRVPLWAPWLAVLLPTLWLWRLDRRRPPGCCPACGYDLTGNTTGTCPECGARAAFPSSPAGGGGGSSSEETTSG